MPKKEHRGQLKWLWLSLIIFLLDQITKYIANTNLLYATPEKVSSFFNFTLLYNYGAAFSFLSSSDTVWQLFFFSSIAIIVTVVLFFVLKNLHKNRKLEAICYSLIIAGALGNVIDRIFYGYVIDFLDFHIGSYHWPAFNVADSAICIGVFLLIIHSIFFAKK